MVEVWGDREHFNDFVSVCLGGKERVCERVLNCEVWTYCVSAVQFLQQSIVCAFGEATLLIDKSQHAQFLKGK